MDKVAVFIDWDNLRSTIASIQKRNNIRNFNYNDPKQLLFLIDSFLEKRYERFYRIFFYTAKMLSLSEIEQYVKDEDYAAFEQWKRNWRNVERYNEKYEISNTFLEQIVLEDYVAYALENSSLTASRITAIRFWCKKRWICSLDLISPMCRICGLLKK